MSPSIAHMARSVPERPVTDTAPCQVALPDGTKLALTPNGLQVTEPSGWTCYPGNLAAVRAGLDDLAGQPTNPKRDAAARTWDACDTLGVDPSRLSVTNGDGVPLVEVHTAPRVPVSLAWNLAEHLGLTPAAVDQYPPDAARREGFTCAEAGGDFTLIVFCAYDPDAQVPA